MVEADGGTLHSLLLTETGTVFACGSGRRGQLGTGRDGSAVESASPLEVPHFAAHGGVSHVCAGALSSYCVASDGQVFAWGCGKQVGMGATFVREEGRSGGGSASFLSTVLLCSALLCPALLCLSWTSSLPLLCSIFVLFPLCSVLPLLCSATESERERGGRRFLLSLSTTLVPKTQPMPPPPLPRPTTGPTRDWRHNDATHPNTNTAPRSEATRRAARGGERARPGLDAGGGDLQLGMQLERTARTRRHA